MKYHFKYITNVVTLLEVERMLLTKFEWSIAGTYRPNSEKKIQPNCYIKC